MDRSRSRHSFAFRAPSRSVRTRLAAGAGAALLATSAAIAPPAAARSAAGRALATRRTASAPTTASATTPNSGTLVAQSANAAYALQLDEALAHQGQTAAQNATAARLDGGASPATVALSVVRNGYLPAALVAQVFKGLLGTTPPASAGESATTRLAAGGTYEALVDRYAGSKAFVAHHPSLHGRLDALSQLLLGRTATTAEQATALRESRAGVTMQVISFELTHSLVYGNRLVNQLVPKTLYRSVSATTNGYWAHEVAAGRIGRINMAALLAASPEAQAYGCDPLAGAGTSCMLPWPNDYYTVPDSTTLTGRRLALKPSFLPANVSGVHVSPVQPNRSDGFSPGSTITVQVPGIDLTQTGAATVDDIDLGAATNSPIVLVDTTTGARQTAWAELDVHGAYSDPSLQPLLIHPTRNLLDGHHYVVALRNLKNAAGTTLAAPPVFAAYRDNGTSAAAGFALRKSHMQSIFSQLATAGVARSNLYLAWDFTVASTANMTGRMLTIRDDAFSKLGTASPAFTVTSNTVDTHTGMARDIKGTFQVPNYLTGTGAPGSTFNEGPDGLPQQNGMLTAPFDCIVPTAALTTPGRPSLYGHGLFGDETEVESGAQQSMSAGHNVVYCATKWAGMSDDDIGVAAGILGDLSGFPMLADRVQQGVLNTLFLGRLMIVTGGLTSDPAFQNTSHQSVIDTSHLYYDGNSQGGIMGGMASAVATDWTRAVLGVSGINYSLLLPRSTDFNTFESIMTPAYPAELSRLLGLELIQLEWDRAEPDGYANHLTSDPLPGTPSHTVLMQIAFGDHQVSNVSADTEARTIGAETNCPSLAAGRSPGTFTLWGVPCIAAFPFAGSAIVYWDSGSTAAPLSDTPPSGGHDPHGDPRSSTVAQQQKSDFLLPSGTVTDVCGGAPCTAPQT